jgi:hypothetical protein
MAEWLRTDQAVCCPAAIVHHLPPVISSAERPTEAPTSSVTPSAVPTDLKHFIKLPNPEIFSNDISPIFENWKNKALNKLECNSWLFSNERTRFA